MKATNALFIWTRNNPSILWVITGIMYLLGLLVSPPSTIAGKIYWTEIISNFCIELFAGSLLALISSLFLLRNHPFLARFAYLFPVSALLSVCIFFLLSIL